jgi:hypothetical protein
MTGSSVVGKYAGIARRIRRCVGAPEREAGILALELPARNMGIKV